MNVDCSVIVPVRNEAGNIVSVLDTVPTMGEHTEVIFVEGGSTDDTWDVITRASREYVGPLSVQCMQQSGIGKWNAVLEGFAAATGDVLIILDGDLAVRADELPRFYDIARGGAFANGSRLRHAMERGAMRPLNKIGNIVYAELSSLVVGKNLSDSLCGTKAIRREDYLRMWPEIAEIAKRDPFGDHTLIFGATMLRLPIRDVQVHYRARTYGSTNISRFSDGWTLLKLIAYAFWTIRLPRLFHLPRSLRPSG